MSKQQHKQVPVGNSSPEWFLIQENESLRSQLIAAQGANESSSTLIEMYIKRVAEVAGAGQGLADEVERLQAKLASAEAARDAAQGAMEAMVAELKYALENAERIANDRDALGVVIACIKRALTPASSSAWASAMDAAEKALTAMLEWVAFNFPNGEQPGKSEPVPAEYMRTALAAIRRARGGGE